MAGSLIGSNASLNCNFNLGLPGSPTVTWFKVNSNGEKQKLAAFDGTQRVGEEVSKKIRNLFQTISLFKHCTFKINKNVV